MIQRTTEAPRIGGENRLAIPFPSLPGPALLVTIELLPKVGRGAGIAAGDLDRLGGAHAAILRD